MILIDDLDENACVHVVPVTTGCFVLVNRIQNNNIVGVDNLLELANTMHENRNTEGAIDLDVMKSLGAELRELKEDNTIPEEIISLGDKILKSINAIHDLSKSRRHKK